MMSADKTGCVQQGYVISEFGRSANIDYSYWNILISIKKEEKMEASKNEVKLSIMFEVQRAQLFVFIYSSSVSI